MKVDKNSAVYTVGFAAVISLVCGIAVAAAAVGLRGRQNHNKLIDMKSKVLVAAGLLPEGSTSASQITKIFGSNVVPVVVNLQTGKQTKDIDPATFDIHKTMKDISIWAKAPGNRAGDGKQPEHSLLYEIRENDQTTTLVLPVQGKGLWSTLYGFVALSADTETVKGLVFYEHGETPGLGGEVDNPRWRNLWVGRKVFDSEYKPALKVVKGAAGPADTDPHHIDGLSGATITARGVTDLVQFWLGDKGYGPTLARYRERTNESAEEEGR